MLEINALTYSTSGSNFDVRESVKSGKTFQFRRISCETVDLVHAQQLPAMFWKVRLEGKGFGVGFCTVWGSNSGSIHISPNKSRGESGPIDKFNTGLVIHENFRNFSKIIEATLAPEIFHKI